MALSYSPLWYQASPLTKYTTGCPGNNLDPIETKNKKNKINENIAAPERIYRITFDIIDGLAFGVASTRVRRLEWRSTPAAFGG